MFTKICTLRSKRLNTQKREKNSLVSLHIYDAPKATKEINLGKYNDFILPAWNGQDANVLSAGVKSSSG
jgi:hypothetical protein